LRTKGFVYVWEELSEFVRRLGPAVPLYRFQVLFIMLFERGLFDEVEITSSMTRQTFRYTS
jgi:hypothetical protein